MFLTPFLSNKTGKMESFLLFHTSIKEDCFISHHVIRGKTANFVGIRTHEKGLGREGGRGTVYMGKTCCENTTECLNSSYTICTGTV